MKSVHEYWKTAAALISLSVVLSFLLLFNLGELPKNLDVGAVVSKDIKADRSYEIVDQEATEKLKKAAMQSVLPVYDFDESLLATKQAQVEQTFEKIYEKVEQTLPGIRKIPWQNLSGTISEELKKIFEEGLGIALSKADWQAVLATELSPNTEAVWKSLLQRVFSHPIISDKTNLVNLAPQGLMLRRIRPEKEISTDERERVLQNFSELTSIEGAKGAVASSELPVALKGAPVPVGIVSLVQKQLMPNTTFNREETELRQKAAIRNVKNILIRIQSGETLIRAGERLEPWHVKLLKAIEQEKSFTSEWFRYAGTFSTLLLILAALYFFVARYLKKYLPHDQDLLFLSLLLATFVGLLRFSLPIGTALHDAYFFTAPRSMLYYAIPVAGVVMLVRLVLPAEIALVFAIATSTLAGLGMEELHFGIFTLFTSLVALLAIGKADHRSAILKTGFFVGLFNIVCVAGIYLAQMAGHTASLTVGILLWHLLFAFLGGLFNSILILVAAPLMEALFGYVTDIKLLELANLNHPLLKELILRAPGTYHHSHIVGILAEAAAQAIGANPLLARVSAYYHDIGKIKKPGYFAENMRVGDNRYEGLSPHMSALIVSSHIKEGMTLGKMHKLPQRIIDMIPQHHGTKRIGFFYEKAKEVSDPSLQTVEERDFRYPGPKPQTSEAGILMLADGAEASVRALKERSPIRIQQMVEKGIDRSFVEAQLDECDLTLKDLHAIGKAFTRILIGIHHQRVEYPEGGPESAAQVNQATTSAFAATAFQGPASEASAAGAFSDVETTLPPEEMDLTEAPRGARGPLRRITNPRR